MKANKIVLKPGVSIHQVLGLLEPMFYFYKNSYDDSAWLINDEPEMGAVYFNKIAQVINIRLLDTLSSYLDNLPQFLKYDSACEHSCRKFFQIDSLKMPTVSLFGEFWGDMPLLYNESAGYGEAGLSLYRSISKLPLWDYCFEDMTSFDYEKEEELSHCSDEASLFRAYSSEFFRGWFNDDVEMSDILSKAYEDDVAYSVFYEDSNPIEFVAFYSSILKDYKNWDKQVDSEDKYLIPLIDTTISGLDSSIGVTLCHTFESEHGIAFVINNFFDEYTGDTCDDRYIKPYTFFKVLCMSLIIRYLDDKYQIGGKHEGKLKEN